jgi:predicted FMN-binding regulatory protein PaiB
VATFERRLSRPWRYDSGERFLKGSAKAVAAYELVVEGIDAAWKLSQDRSAEERRLIAAELEKSEQSGDRAIAALVRATNEIGDR